MHYRKVLLILTHRKRLSFYDNICNDIYFCIKYEKNNFIKELFQIMGCMMKSGINLLYIIVFIKVADHAPSSAGLPEPLAPSRESITTLDTDNHLLFTHTVAFLHNCTRLSRRIRRTKNLKTLSTEATTSWKIGRPLKRSYQFSSRENHMDFIRLPQHWVSRR